MQEPSLRHSYVQLNRSFVHLVQYGCSENLVRSSTVSPNSSQINITPSATHNTTPKAATTTTNQLAASTTTTTITTRSILGSSNNSSLLDNNSKADRGNHDTISGEFASGAAAKSHQQHSSRRNMSFGKKTVIIFIPGNPGVLGVYHDFLRAIFRIVDSGSACENKNPDERPTVLAISHNNFDHPDHVEYKAEKRICIEENELNFVEKAIAKKHYNQPHHIELQVLNKLIILKRVLKVDLTDCKLVFIGHSIGCYVILRLLQDRSISGTHAGSILIHPALENLALTEKGQFFDRLFNYKFDLIMRSAAFVLDRLLPKKVKLMLTKWICSSDFVQGSSDIVVESCMQLVCQKTLAAIIEMSKSEFAFVKSINHESLIKPHVAKLKLIYAIDDHWVNTENRRELSEHYPELYMEEKPTKHAFIMDPQTVMDYAVKVGIFLQDCIESTD